MQKYIYNWLAGIYCVVYAGAVFLSCGEYDPLSIHRPDTTTVDTSVGIPANLTVDSLVITTLFETDSAGRVTDTVLTGAFTVSMDSVLGASFYRVLLWDDTAAACTVYPVLSRKSRFTGIGARGKYWIKAQAVKVVRVPGTLTLDTFPGDTSALFVPVNLYLPEPPERISIDYADSMALVSWQPVSHPLLTGYRVYLLNYAGGVVDSQTVAAGAREAALFRVGENTIYRVAVASVASSGRGGVYARYAYDPSAPAGAGLRLPYLYLSTFRAPDCAALSSVVLGAGSMAGVRGGIVIMGDIWRPGASAAAQPIHEVVLSSFCMHRSEITVAHYIRFLNECELVTSLPGTVAGTRVFIGCGDTLLSAPVQADSLSGALIVPPDTAAYPVTGVSWTGAALFCNWLSEQDGLKACYDTSDWSLDSTANGYRLPTEAEFEYAHSAAFLSTKQRYPWGYGDDPRRYGSLASGLHAIGFFGPFNGLYDMSGNALEWCHDFSDASAPPDSSYYAYCQSRGVVFDPMGPPGGERHVLRGGSYLQNGDMCSSVYRHTAEDAPWSGCGFRVVRRIP